MRSYQIYIDGFAYLGEDVENSTPANYGGGGWHIKNNNAINNLIIADAQPKIIEGDINFRSDIDRIIRRIKHGQLKIKKILIEIADDKG